MSDPKQLARALGELLSEPKQNVVFGPGPALQRRCAVFLAPRSRMLYDAQHVFINGESFRASGRDAILLRRLADRHMLAPEDVLQLSAQARSLVGEWARCGWLEVRDS